MNNKSNCHIEALFDNIRSAYNVGSMFRSADGSGIMHLHLCGVTATPNHSRVAKTALGAEYAVPWTYHPDAILIANAKKERGFRLWALEDCQNSISIFDSLNEVPGSPILFIVGNEIHGVDPGFNMICERYISIPMLGYKRSLNVATAFGIAAYLLTFAANIQDAICKSLPTIDHLDK